MEKTWDEVKSILFSNYDTADGKRLWNNGLHKLQHVALYAGSIQEGQLLRTIKEWEQLLVKLTDDLKWANTALVRAMDTGDFKSLFNARELIEHVMTSIKQITEE